MNNLLITFVILFLTAKITSNKMTWRIYIASFLGGLSSIIYPSIHLTGIMSTLFKIALGSIIISMGFHFEKLKQFAFTFITFIGLTGVYGGVIIAINYCFKDISIPLGIVSVLILAITYFIVMWLKIIMKKQKFNHFIFNIKIIANNNEICLEAFLDTGNTLIDPINNMPIVILGLDAFKKIYSNIKFTDILLGKLGEVSDAHYIDVGTAVKGGKMLVFKLDKILIDDFGNEKVIDNVYAGLSYSTFKNNFNCDVLLNPMLF